MPSDWYTDWRRERDTVLWLGSLITDEQAGAHSYLYALYFGGPDLWCYVYAATEAPDAD